MTEPGTLPEGIEQKALEIYGTLRSSGAWSKTLMRDEYLAIVRDIGNRCVEAGAAQERARHDWQPIATAPQHEQVWTWDDNRGSNPAMLIDGVWLITYDDAEIKPTHWMPLPEPPKVGHG